MRILCISMCCLLLLTSAGYAQSQSESISKRTAEMTYVEGFIPFYWDESAGKVWLEITRFDQEFLYVSSLPAGIGSNDIGLDRGQLGGRHVVTFTRSGPTVLLVEKNYAFRATTDNPAERRAVEDAFARSVLAGFTIEATEGDAVLVDATSLFFSDGHGVIRSLSRSGQGSYSLDRSRSAFHLPMTKNFPQNTEVEVMLTFTGKDPGRWVRSVTPTPEAITVRQRHSFVRLPDDGYVPRQFDARGGFFGIRYADYAAPIGEPLVKQFIARHRLQKKDPSQQLSEPVEPIVYYVDPGTPEPIRSALIDGALWWDEAFRAAGFLNAFRVEVLPADADPMDVRYNVIQWVHRSTRGWSYGATVTDPRTGEIIKGHVSLGSLRARQDYLIAEGLLAPYAEGKAVSDEMNMMALARLRQLSAHEVGHTLGLSHNYISSSFDRASVMDYPHPLARIKEDGSVDLSDAYDAGIGEWDKVAIEYGYREYPQQVDSDEASREVLLDALSRGLVFLSDQDARPPGSAEPATHLWDNGTSAVDELNRIMRVRRAALSRFSEQIIPEGRPLATLEEALVPLYLGHRYQVEAASKVIGGATYRYAHRGDGQMTVRAVHADEQRRARSAILKTLTPDALVLPDNIAGLIPPRPFGYGSHRELFPSSTAPLFDQLAPAEAAAEHTLRFLFNDERANRLVQQHASDEGMPGLAEHLRSIVESIWLTENPEGVPGEVSRIVQSVTLDHMMSLAIRSSSVQVRALTMAEIIRLGNELTQLLEDESDAGHKAHLLYHTQKISRFLEDPAENAPEAPARIPPGQPIGSLQSDCSGMF